MLTQINVTIWHHLVTMSSERKRMLQLHTYTCMHIHISVCFHINTAIRNAMLITTVTIISWWQVYTLFTMKRMLYIIRMRYHSIHLSCHTPTLYYWSIILFVALQTLLTLHNGIIKQLWQEYTELGQPIFTYTWTKSQKEPQTPTGVIYKSHRVDMKCLKLTNACPCRNWNSIISVTYSQGPISIQRPSFQAYRFPFLRQGCGEALLSL